MITRRAFAPAIAAIAAIGAFVPWRSTTAGAFDDTSKPQQWHGFPFPPPPGPGDWGIVCRYENESVPAKWIWVRAKGLR
jgi:hypothetical protein